MKYAPLLLVVAALGAGPQMAGPDLERDARALEAMLIAPCCFSQQVSVHESPAADEVRQDVRARLAAGQTRQQIVDAYVARYGKRVLAVPPPKGFDVTLYAVPIVVFFVTAGAGVWVIRRLSRRSSTGSTRSDAAPETGAASAADEARLDDALRDLD